MAFLQLILHPSLAKSPQLGIQLKTGGYCTTGSQMLANDSLAHSGGLTGMFGGQCRVLRMQLRHQENPG